MSEEFTYYCQYCGNFLIRTSKKLSKVERRDADMSHVLRIGELLELNADYSGITNIMRTGKGVERQVRYNCKNCKLPFCYFYNQWQSQENEFGFILKAAVSAEKQSKKMKMARTRRQEGSVETRPM